MTPCNHCTLQGIRRRAETEGVEVKLWPAHVVAGGDWYGWWAAVRSDKPEPVAYFMQVTEHCVC